MSGLAHCFHLIMTIIFFPWVVIWICCAASASNKRSKVDRDLMRRQTAALEKLAETEKWRRYRD